MPDVLAPCGCPASALFQRFRAAERGNVTVLMALAFLGTVLAAGAAIDYARLLGTRTALAAAADAAALQVGTSQLSSPDALKALAEDVLARNYDGQRHGELVDLDLDLGFHAVGLTATARFETAFMGLAGIETIDLPVFSEVTRSGSNLEVALVLDTTGSMSGNRIAALKVAAADFVDEVVWDDQDEFYAKVALVPYSMGVNLGDRAADARGNVGAGTCTSPGCQSYRFRNARGNNRTLSISSCVSERVGSEALTDAPASTHPVGRNYASPNNPCLEAELVPLSADRESLKDAIDDLKASGSTAGQVGIAWGWYALSKDFGLWQGDSTPSAYGAEHVSKIAVIMTDGAFNTSYCRGVVARNAGNGSGSADDKINCDASNGSSTAQAEALCTEMKKKGITIYTVGFDIEDEEEAQAVMTNCASSAQHAYLAATNAELKEAFRDIGRKLTSVRLSR